MGWIGAGGVEPRRERGNPIVARVASQTLTSRVALGVCDCVTLAASGADAMWTDRREHGYTFLILMAIMIIISLLDKRGQQKVTGIIVDASEFKISTPFAIGTLLLIGILAALYIIFW